MPDAIVEREGQTMVITMNRPKRYNALSGQMLIRMYDAMVEASADDDIRCIILTGAGGNFSSGADLKAMAGNADDTDPDIDVPARMAADPDLPWKGLLRHYRPTKPLIAAVEGVAIAGGTEILPGHRHPRRRRERALRRERGPLVALPDGAAARCACAARSPTRRRRDPAHRQAHHGGRGVPRRAHRSRRARRHRARQGARDRGDHLRQRPARGRGDPAHAAGDRRHGPRARRSRTSSSTGRRSSSREDSKEGPQAFAEKRKPNFQRK